MKKYSHISASLITILLAAAILLLGICLPTFILDMQKKLLLGNVYAQKQQAMDILPSEASRDASYFRNLLEACQGTTVSSTRDPLPNELSMENAVLDGLDYLQSWIDDKYLPQPTIPLREWQINAAFQACYSISAETPASLWQIEYSSPYFGERGLNFCQLTIDAATGAVIALDVMIFSQDSPYSEIDIYARRFLNDLNLVDAFTYTPSHSSDAFSENVEGYIYFDSKAVSLHVSASKYSDGDITSLSIRLLA